MGNKVKLKVFFVIFAAVLFLLTAQPLLAQPGTPPPPGKVWVKVDTGWILVSAPPADAPFIWVVNHWERIVEIPPGKEWVPPHWGANGWVPGHWRAVVYPYKGAAWVPGHWGLKGHWVPGHWKAGPGPRLHPRRPYRVWVPGHRGPRGRWIHGHWR